MIRSIILIFALSFVAPAAMARLSPFAETESEGANLNATQARLAQSFFQCLNVDGKSQCRDRLGRELEQLGATEREANWQFLICLEEQSSANGTTYSQVVGLCRTLSQLEDASSPEEISTSEL